MTKLTNSRQSLSESPPMSANQQSTSSSSKFSAWARKIFVPTAAEDLSPSDREFFARTTVRIGLRVAIVCAGLVVLGAVLFLIYLWSKSSPITPTPGASTHDLRFRLEFDPIDLIVAGILLGICAVFFAGMAAVWISNRAVEPLAESFRRQRTFIADASHELRTPLAVLSARSQHLQRLTANDDKLQALSASLRDDVREMVDIVDDLLATASFDATAEPCNLLEVLDHTVAPLQVLAEKKHVSVQVNPPANGQSELWVPVPHVALRRTLSALIDNAIGHSPENSTVIVDISASRSGKKTGKEVHRNHNEKHEQRRHRSRENMVTVLVQDSGDGITGIDANRVFERFATGTASTATPGRASHGIGLALVADVAARYGGEATVESTGPEGTTFAIRLPLVPRDA